MELTVEDPNEAFDALRDTADYHILLPEFTKHEIDINSDPYEVYSRKQRPRRVPTADLIPVKLLHDIRLSYKIAPTQFAHVLEMYLLSRIPFKNRQAGGANMARLLIKKFRVDDPNERRYYWWRLLVKQRIYKRSRDVLIQLDLTDRIEKLDETVSNVEDGYESTLKGFGDREEALKAREEEVEQITSQSADNTDGGDQSGKRKFADENEQQQGESEAAKRPRV